LNVIGNSSHSHVGFYRVQFSFNLFEIFDIWSWKTYSFSRKWYNEYNWKSIIL